MAYLVTGSAQRSGPGMLRVNMRITDAATTEYLWAGRHEFRPEDLATVQAAWKAWSANADRLIPTTWRVGMPKPA